MNASPYPFTDIVDSEHVLADIVGPAGDVARRKERDALDHHMRAFIADSPFLTLATFASDGRCDVSPRGDRPGFVLVTDDHTLVIPERPGNRRTDSMKNVLQTGRAAVLFMIPGFGETLRVNGRARVIKDAAILAGLAVDGKTPHLAIAVDVEECFLHCARAIHRAKLWAVRPDARPAATPTSAAILVEHAGMQHELPADEFDRILQDAYKNELY